MALTRVFAALLLLWALPAADLPAQAAPREGLLWQVQAGHAPPSWLFGTIHSEDPRVLRVPESVEQALASARELLLEMVPDPDNLAELVREMLLPDEGDLEGLLGPRLMRRTQTALIELGVAPAVARRMRPWAAVLVLSMPRARTGVVLDLALYQRALALERPVAALESVGEQVAIFAELAERDQIALLRGSLDELQEGQRVQAELVEAYLASDLERMRRLGEQAMAGQEPRLAREIHRRLITDRNRRMLERMRPSLDHGGAFVAVGALHLPGEDGLLAGLAGLGYRLRRIY
jgi:hypothetical protein